MENFETKSLVDLIFNQDFDNCHKDLVSIISNEIFDNESNLNLSEAGRISYERCRFIHSKIEKPLEVLDNPNRLFAVAEWAGISDVSCFSIMMVHYNLTIGTYYDSVSYNNKLMSHLEELNNLQSFGPYMATELGYGNNVASLKTEAVYDHDKKCFYINTPDLLSQKYMSYSGFHDIPKIAIVMARLKIDSIDHGVFPFSVRISDDRGLCPGIKVIRCPEKPVQGLDNALTSFDNVEISSENILLGEMAEISVNGEFIPKIKNRRSRFLKSMSRIIPGRLCVSSSALGAGKASCYIALKYAQQRLVNTPGGNDTEIINFRIYQYEMFLNLAKTYAMIALTNNSKSLYLKDVNNVDLDTINQINITKALVTWNMADVVSSCRERCGAQGIFSINRITDYISLLQGLVTAEGDNQVLIATVSGQLINSESEEYVLSDYISELSSENILKMLKARESSIKDEIIKKKETINSGFFKEWNMISNQAIELAKIKGNIKAIEALYSWDAKSNYINSLLDSLVKLFGINIIKNDMAWYMNQDLINKEALLSVNEIIENICEYIAPHINILLDSFKIDNDVLKSPICHPGYEKNFTETSLKNQ